MKTTTKKSETIYVIRTVRLPLTESEMASRKDELPLVISQEERLADRRKSLMAQLKEEAEDLSQKKAQLVEEINSGERVEDLRCLKTPVLSERCWNIMHPTTGEVLERIPMTWAEVEKFTQTTIPEDDEEEAPAQEPIVPEERGRVLALPAPPPVGEDLPMLEGEIVEVDEKATPAENSSTLTESASVESKESLDEIDIDDDNPPTGPTWSAARRAFADGVIAADKAEYISLNGVCPSFVASSRVANIVLYGRSTGANPDQAGPRFGDEFFEAALESLPLWLAHLDAGGLASDTRPPAKWAKDRALWPGAVSLPKSEEGDHDGLSLFEDEKPQGALETAESYAGKLV